jgi:hypothetical protein
MRPLLLGLTFCIGTSVSSAARSQPSPVLTSSGSGIFVSYDGHVLTNNHVIEDCSRLRMEQPASGAMVATVVARDVSNDLALLRTSSRPTIVAKFRSQTRLGQSIYVFGFPMFPNLSLQEILPLARSLHLLALVTTPASSRFPHLSNLETAEVHSSISVAMSSA